MSRWLRIDLHIHSALSACALPEMTPNNIVNMASVLGLDVIAVTDHHAAANVLPILDLAQQAGIICIPGIEVQSREDVHLLCYFQTYQPLRAFTDFVTSLLDPQIQLPKNLGKQLIFDETDTIIGEESRFLHQSIPLSTEELWRVAESFGACCLPAHIDRPAFGILSQLGFIPPSLPVKVVEVTMGQLARPSKHLPLDGMAVITASDAHSLEQMVTPGHSQLHPSLNSVTRIWQWLRNPQIDLLRSFQSELED